MGTMARPLKNGQWRRARVARELGISIARVRALEAAGALKPTIDKDGAVLYDPRAVRAFAKKRPPRVLVQGELASKVFRMIKDGFPLRDIVIELKLPPETVRKLHDEYRRELVESPPDRELADFDRRNAETDQAIDKQRRRAAGGEHLS
jgi:DNA-binding transcriptional MerR regulator